MIKLRISYKWHYQNFKHIATDWSLYLLSSSASSARGGGVFVVSSAILYFINANHLYLIGFLTSYLLNLNTNSCNNVFCTALFQLRRLSVRASPSLYSPCQARAVQCLASRYVIICIKTVQFVNWLFQLNNISIFHTLTLTCQILNNMHKLA